MSGLELIFAKKVSNLTIWDIAWCPHDNQFVVCGGDKIVHLFKVDIDPINGSVSVDEVGSLEDAHKRTIRRCQWSPDNKFLASVSFDGTCVGLVRYIVSMYYHLSIEI